MVVVLILPLASWLDGSGQLAWTMFSRTGQYRIAITADGKPVNPTEIAAAAAPGMTSLALAGADHFKHHDVWRATARRHLAEIAELTCRIRPGAEVSARLEEKRTTEAPIEATVVSIRCP